MSVTAPGGFSASGVASGIKSGDLDLALIVADAPATAAAVFTTNTAAAPPVELCRSHLAVSSKVSAVVANSGCANAGTGAQGKSDALAMADGTALLAGCPVDQVLVASTGPIGPVLPMAEVLDGIASAHGALDSTEQAGTLAARSIMTTDTIAKEVTVAGPGFTVGGMAKGSGMIRPDMATMLCFLTTDAVLDPADLQAALTSAVDASFHALNIDGCGSTNDTVVVLASGASGVSPELSVLEAALTQACVELAGMMAADAEGASRVVTIEVSGARDDRAARDAGRAIADSALVRASFYGGDPNWGRLLGALGASELSFDANRFGVAYNGIHVAAGGVAIAHDAPAALDNMESGDLAVSVTVGDGPGRATILTTDLTPEYVVFNGERS
jgi:glutamate N-acetyltransferase/amino-acid N-acetyltransferase